MFLVPVCSHSTFCSNIIAETGISCCNLGENQDSFIGCRLDTSVSTAFAEAFVVACALLQVVSASSSGLALPVKCSQHRGIQAGFIEPALVLDQFNCVSPYLAV